MRTHRVRSLAGLAILIVLVFLGLVLLSDALIQKPSVQKILLNRLFKATGFHIQADKIEVNLWRGVGILAHGLTASSGQRPESLRAARVRIILDVSELIRGRIVPLSLYLFEPKMELGPLEAGRISQATRGPLIKGLPIFWIPGFQSVSVQGGQVRFQNTPFYLRDLFLDLHKEGAGPANLMISSRGKIARGKERAAFGLRGRLSEPEGAGKLPPIDARLEMERVPIKWIFWPASISAKEGGFKADLKMKGHLGGPISVKGEIATDAWRFLVFRHDRTEEFSLPGMTLDFMSVLKGKKIRIPTMRLRTSGASLRIALHLDLTQVANPYVEVEVKSPPIGLHPLRRILPAPFLPPWVRKTVFSLLDRGEIGLERLSFKGRLEQLQSLGLPENQSLMSMKLRFRNFQLRGKGAGIPFKGISADLTFEKGVLIVTGLKAAFGSSKVNGGKIRVGRIFSGAPSFDGFLDGSFDLTNLMSAGVMDLIPPLLRQRINNLGPVEGRLECQTKFRYEYGWEFPQIVWGDFLFRDLSVVRQKLLLPLILKVLEVRINEKNDNHFRGRGAWGKSTFKVSGDFGLSRNGLDFRKADISAAADVKEFIQTLYGTAKFPLEWSGPVPSQVSISRRGDLWAMRGDVNLEGVALKTDAFQMDPPGSGDKILFQMDLRPGERIVFNKLVGEFGPSVLQLSGEYDLKGHDLYSAEFSSSRLSLEDLGIRFKGGAGSPRGLLKGRIKVRVSRQDPSRSSVAGFTEGQNLSLRLSKLPSPIDRCDFRFEFSGREAFIPFWKMRIGKSSLEISGHLKGWDRWKGAIKVDSDNLIVQDLLLPDKGRPFWDRIPGMGGWMDHLDMGLKLDILQGRFRDLSWGPLKADLVLRRGDIYITRSSLTMDHGVLTTKGHAKRKGQRDLMFSGHIQLTEQPIEALMKGLHIQDQYVGGNLTMEAFLYMKGKERRELIPSLTGIANVLIKEGEIRKTNAFIKILDFLSLEKIFLKKPPDLSEEGFYFESLEGHGTINRGILDTKSFVMKSPVFNAVASGKVDVARRRVDYDLGVNPLGTVDILVSKIPILGYLLTGKEKSILTYYFKVKGPLSDPDVKYVPFKNLGRGTGGTLKRLFLTPVRIFKDLSKAAKEYPAPVAPWPEGEEE